MIKTSDYKNKIIGLRILAVLKALIKMVQYWSLTVNKRNVDPPSTLNTGVQTSQKPKL